MKKLLLLLLVGSAITAKAQSEKKTRLNDSSEVVYFVDASGSKDGIYTIKNLSNDGVWAQGSYKNGERQKNWNFFASDFKLAVRYDYDTKKLMYLNNDMMKDVIIKIISDDDAVKKGASVPVPLCSVDYLTLLEASSMPANVDAVGDKAEITAHIGADGKAFYSVVYIGTGKKTKPVFFKLPEDKFNVDWIPASYNNKPVDAEFVVYADVKTAESTSGMRRSSWNN